VAADAQRQGLVSWFALPEAIRCLRIIPVRSWPRISTKGEWRRDVFAFRDTCQRHKIPVAIERSRSGNGAHAWIFFEEPIPAASARRLGAFLITDTMERVPDIGFGSYDRFFPTKIQCRWAASVI
jgi:hypothetical protein